MSTLSGISQDSIGWMYPIAVSPTSPAAGELSLLNGITALVNGQGYIDVVFPVPQPDANWLLLERDVVNTTDATPLNIWPGLITIKAATGFRIQLNGTPDSANYFFHWAITGVGGEIEPPPPPTGDTTPPTAPSSLIATPLLDTSGDTTPPSAPGGLTATGVSDT